MLFSLFLDFLLDIFDFAESLLKSYTPKPTKKLKKDNYLDMFLSF